MTFGAVASRRCRAPSRDTDRGVIFVTYSDAQLTVSLGDNSTGGAMGTVIAFSKSAPRGARFSNQDRKEFLQWQIGRARLRRLRTIIHDAGTLGDTADHEFAQIYEPAAQWASWGLARVGHGILVWECAHGTDLGVFGSISEAITCVEFNAGEPPN